MWNFKNHFVYPFRINISNLISLVVIIDSEIELLKVSDIFSRNAHIQFKVGVINASILQVCESKFLKKTKKLQFVFDQFLSGDTCFFPSNFGHMFRVRSMKKIIFVI